MQQRYRRWTSSHSHLLAQNDYALASDAREAVVGVGGHDDAIDDAEYVGGVGLAVTPRSEVARREVFMTSETVRGASSSDVTYGMYQRWTLMSHKSTLSARRVR